jgi:hypothetical protein
VAPVIAPAAWVAGLAAASWMLWRVGSGPDRCSLSIAAAWVVHGLVLIGLAVLGVPPSPAAALVVLGLAVAVHARRRSMVAQPPTSTGRDRTAAERGRAPWWAWPVAGAAAARLVWHLMHWPWARPWSWDFYAVWGFKARFLYDGGGLWGYLAEAGRYPFSHGEYPFLVPAHLAAVSWPVGDGWLAWLPDLVLAAAVLWAWCTLWWRHGGPGAAAAMAFLLVWSPNLWGPDLVGLADRQLALVAGLVVAVLLVEPARSTSLPVVLLLAGVAMTKNEGLVLTVLLVVAVLLGREPDRRWRIALGLVPAACWLLLVAAHGLSSDRLHGEVVGGELPEKLSTTVRETVRLVATPDWGVLFLAAAAGVVWVALRGPRRWVAAALIVQAAVLTLVTVGGAYDLAWQLATAWPRLLVQLLPAGLACLGWSLVCTVGAPVRTGRAGVDHIGGVG